MNKLPLRLKVNLILFSLVMILGTVGFSAIEQHSLLDSAYFTIETVSTVGYGDLAPQTPAGRILTIILTVTGVGTFLGVIAGVAELFLNRREHLQRHQKTQMLVGIFFSELGTRLLRYCADSDMLDQSTRRRLAIDSGWNAARYQTIRNELPRIPFRSDIDKIGIEELRDFLGGHGNFLARTLENPSLIEHEGLTDLLIAILHLKEELHYRDDLSALPESDLNHLRGDLDRVYQLLALHWLNYVEHLQQEYPFLYSLAVRMNPFNREAEATVY